MNNKKPSIIYVPLELGAKYGGTDAAPNKYKELGLGDALSSAGVEIVESVDIACKLRNDLVPEPADRPFIEEILSVNTVVADKVVQAVNQQATPVVIGGDHSVNLGAFAGASSAVSGSIGMIYIDAHADANTPESSTSHNVHGMHLAALMGFGSDDMVNFHGEGAKLDSTNLLHVAGKDFDEFEVSLFKEENISNYSIQDIVMYGLSPLAKQIKELASRVDNIWVSFDLDSVDSEYAPGVGIPARGGLTYREAINICSFIAEECNVVGFDIVECNPPRDIDDKTAKLGIEIATRLLGSKQGDYSEYMNQF